MGKERSFHVTYRRRYLYSDFVYFGSTGERRKKFHRSTGKWMYEECVIIAENEDEARDIFVDEVDKMSFPLPKQVRDKIENDKGCIDTQWDDLDIREDK